MGKSTGRGTVSGARDTAQPTGMWTKLNTSSGLFGPSRQIRRYNYARDFMVLTFEGLLFALVGGVMALFSVRWDISLVPVVMGVGMMIVYGALWMVESDRRTK